MRVVAASPGSVSAGGAHGCLGEEAKEMRGCESIPRNDEIRAAEVASRQPTTAQRWTTEPPLQT